MDTEFKKLLAGDLWAESGDRVDMDDASIQPTIDRAQGYPVAFSTDTAPARARINQILRELSGAAKEVRMGVSEYDAEVDYPAGAMCQVSGNIYYAVSAHDSSSPVNPIAQNQSTWTIVAGRTATERGRPDFIPLANIFVDGDRADQFAVWWFADDNGGYDIDQAHIQWSKDSTFATGVSQEMDYTPGEPKPISTNDSDLFYIRIRMHNSAGWSAWSAAKQVRSSPVQPGAVITLQASQSSLNGGVTVRWKKPETNGLIVETYRLQWRNENQNWSDTERTTTYTNQTGTSLQHFVQGLSSSLFTTLRVYAISNRSTTSPDGNEDTLRAIGLNAPPAQPRVAVSYDVPTRVRTYIDGVFNDGGNQIDYHEFSWRIKGGDWDASRTTNTSSKYILINRARTDVLEIRARAHNAQGFSPYSPTFEVPAYTPAVPEKPNVSVATSLTAVEGALKGIASFSMNDLSKEEVVHDYITQTAVRWKRASDTNWTLEQSAEFDGLDENRYGIPQIFPASGNLPIEADLDVQARLKNTGGWGAWSDTISLSEASAPSGNIIFTASSVSVTEGRTATLGLQLSRIPIENVSVAITSSNTDLTVSPTSLTFTRDNWNTDQTITLSAVEDADLVTDTATLSFAISGGLDSTTDTIPVTINERARLITNFMDGNVSSPTGGQPLIVFGLTSQPDSNVVISISDPVGDAPVNILPSGIETLTFTPNNWKTAQSIRIFTASDVNNTDDSATITFTVTGAITEQFTKTITVREHPNTRVTWSGASSQRVGAGLQRTWNVRCTRVPDAAFTANLVTIEPNVTVSPTSLTFTRTNWNVNQSFTLSASSAAPFPGLTYISIEPQNAADVVSAQIPVALSHPITSSPATYFVPEGNDIGVVVQLVSTPTGDVKLTFSSDNSDISFTDNNGSALTNNAINLTSANSFTGLVRLAAEIDADIASENDPVLITPSGAISGPQLIVPTTMAESTNSIATTADFDTALSPNTLNAGTYQFSLLNDSLEDINLQISVSGSLSSVINNTVSINRGNNGPFNVVVTTGDAGTGRITIRAVPASVESIPIYTSPVIQVGSP